MENNMPCVHHIEVGAIDALQATRLLRDKYNFKVKAIRRTEVCTQWFLENVDARFLVTSLDVLDNDDKIQKDNYLVDWMKVQNKDTLVSHKLGRKDSVFNVCFEMSDLEASVKRLKTHGVEFIKHPQTVSDSLGSVKTCTIKSCVGDICHTLIEKQNYNGVFLPGFEAVDDENCFPRSVDESIPTDDNENNDSFKGRPNKTQFQNENSSKGAGQFQCNENKTDRSVYQNGSTEKLKEDQRNGNNGVLPVRDSSETFFDHVAIAVHQGTSPKVLEWYECRFGMKRFLINSLEDPNEGLVLSTSNVGLRLRAMEYWKCAEVGLLSTSRDGKTSRLPIVVVEGLPVAPGATENNAIESWLSHHRGPGIHHIALNTNDIISTVKKFKGQGADFANPPPPAYYTEVGRLHDIERTGEDLESLREHGILIDTEADHVPYCSTIEVSRPESCEESYLLQVFTKPLLPDDSFFLELIQREGATGFGSGNIAALYRSVMHYMGEANKNKTTR